ncbi:hypothetical protein ACFWWM_01005 [Streptomyces sp. NPDC058682]|uniref:hypothetical protein n=1 Tax=Streptomyces sp. NPDC058682 TaxID=3346596 RepID=UPI003650AA06
MSSGDLLLRTVHRIDPVGQDRIRFVSRMEITGNGRRRGRPADRPGHHRRPARHDGLAGRAGASLMPLSPGFLLWHATLRWQRDIATVLAPFDLTHVQCVLLSCTWWLNTRGAHPDQLAVARQAGPTSR